MSLESLQEQAYAEVEEIIHWMESSNATDLCNALGLVNTDESCEAIDLIHGIEKPNPGGAVSAQLKAVITAQAQDWIPDRVTQLQLINRDELDLDEAQERTARDESRYDL